MTRVTVPKTYKLYLGGGFPRSESGRTYPVADAKGAFMANAAQSSRKDLRDAVSAARKGFGSWASATPYNRGQVIYRIAEMVEGRARDFAGLLRTGHGMSAARADEEVQRSVDRLVHYAGWTDKLSVVFGGANPVSSPYFCYSAPEPTGVVGVIAPPVPALLGLVSAIAPVIAGGNACVVLVERDPCVAITFAEALATADVPAGVINILTGLTAEVSPFLAAHKDVNALDLTGAAPGLRTELQRSAADTIKRVYVPRGTPDFVADPGTARLRAFLEVKTVWHPVGAVSLAGGGGY